MRPVIAQLGPFAAASAASILTATTVSGAGSLTLTGTTLDVARRLLFTSSGNDSGITFTVIGADPSNNKVTEVVTGGISGAAARTVLDYKTLTSIAASGATAGTLQIGTALTGGVASTPWVRLDGWALPNVAIQCTVSGAVNFTVQSTLDDPNDPTNSVAPANMAWVNSADSNAVAVSATVQTNYLFAPRFVRTLVNSGAGSVTMTVLQSGGK